MNLLKELEGLTGENLTSAALRFLLVRSQDVRESFIKLISKMSKQGPILLQSEFSCRREFPTTNSQMEAPDLQNESGRIDLLMNTDNMIIGIENKLDAPFQPGQPEKYRQQLEKLAAQASDTGEKRRYVLVILAPEDRTEEIKKIIAKSPNPEHRSHYIDLYWGALLTEFKERCGPNLDRTSATVIDLLWDYYFETYKPFWPDEQSVTHLQGVYDRNGVHGNFLEHLIRLIPPSFTPGRSGGKERWIGRSFQRQQQDPPMSEYGWLGFVNTKAKPKVVKEELEHDTELVLVSTKEPTSPLPPQLRKVSLSDVWWAPKTLAWVIDYDGDQKWRDRETWRNLFNSVLQ